MPTAEFRERLRELNGTPEELLRDPELMQIVLPRLRSDFELAETYRCAELVPLDCPITAFGGADDREVPRTDLEAWRLASRNKFELRVFPGDHFYLDRQGRTLRSQIRRSLLGGT
jgi:medium-chain acyl-[acyl-carrier-protein] hydrolase